MVCVPDFVAGATEAGAGAGAVGSTPPPWLKGFIKKVHIYRMQHIYWVKQLLNISQYIKLILPEH